MAVAYSLMVRRVGLVVAMLLLAGLLSPAPAAAAGRCGDVRARPWCDTSLSPDRRARLLLDAMTLPEKVSLLAGDDYFGAVGGEHVHTGTSNGVDRVGIPVTYYSDGPVGPRQGKTTGMPVPMALAATFDKSLAAAYGDVVANEVRSKGNDVVYAPTINLLRNPLWGRTFESFGEDPYLTTRTAVSWIKAAQATGVITSVKHFAAYNQEGYYGPAANTSSPDQPFIAAALQSPVGDRHFVDVRATERTLREMYLPAFEASIREAKAGVVMCSYNRVGSDWACQNEWLLTQVLRKDWGFQGYVLADYGATHTTADQLEAGLEFEPYPFPAHSYQQQVVEAALATGVVTAAQVDRAAGRILRTHFAYGYFDRPAYRDDDAQIDKPAHARTSQRVEENAITLLRNNGLLPLDAARLKTLAVIGADADGFKTGGGSSHVTPFAVSTPREAITQRAGSGVRVTYDDGTDPARAAAVAKASDVAVVFASDYQTESVDRYCLTLECPNAQRGDQDGLIERVLAANPRTVVVLETGGPVLTPWRSRTAALMEAWYPGQEGGRAIARVLFGDVDPGGRLPATFPESESQLPTAGDVEMYPGVANEVQYKEGVLVGYRWYDAKGLQPAYPFGHGLSYTSFRYDDLRVQPGVGGVATVSARITNTGRRAGTAVPQLYVGLPSPRADVVQPPRQLRGYEKVHLAPGESRVVSFPLDRRALSYWDEPTSGWQIAPGCYPMSVGRSSRDLPLRAVASWNSSTCGAAAVSLTGVRAPVRPAGPAAAPPQSLPTTGADVAVGLGGLLLLVAAVAIRRPVRPAPVRAPSAPTPSRRAAR